MEKYRKSIGTGGEKMIVVYFLAAQVVMALFFYPLLVVGKRADEEMGILFERRFQENGQRELEDKMESQRDVLRTIEKEISKGSAPVHFEGMEFEKDSYHLVDSQAKMNQLLDYFFRVGEYGGIAGKLLKSNVYMDAAGKKPTFRTAKSEFDRKRMEMAAKQWIKKKQPSFDGDVYVENVKCVLSLTEEEKEKRKCRVNGEETAALIFSRKHLAALYLQCLMCRKELALQKGSLDDMSEICNRIYRLEDVEVLFQCMMMDMARWDEDKLYIQFSTVFLLEK